MLGGCRLRLECASCELRLTYFPGKNEQASSSTRAFLVRRRRSLSLSRCQTDCCQPAKSAYQAELPAHVPQARQHPEKSDSCTYSRSKITPASTPSTTTHITAKMSQPSLAPYVMKRPWLMRWAQPLSKWYFDNAGYRKLGLRYERTGGGGGGHWVARLVQ
jgi:hypothetical protein